MSDLCLDKPESTLSGSFYLVPVDFFSPCREQLGWLLTDWVQTLFLVASQGLPNAVLVEPELSHARDDNRWKVSGIMSSGY